MAGQKQDTSGGKPAGPVGGGVADALPPAKAAQAAKPSKPKAGGMSATSKVSKDAKSSASPAKPAAKKAASSGAGAKSSAKKESSGAVATAPSASTKKVAGNSSDAYVPRLKGVYLNVVRPDLVKEFKYPSYMAAPRIEKVVLNMGVGEATQDRKKVDGAERDITLIAGQKAIKTRARKSIAGFKLRDGMVIGACVTLRRDRMWEFLDRLINVALPRQRDFRGLKITSFDGRGNYSLGLREQIVFTEIDYDAVDEIRGLDVSIATSAKTDSEARALLKGLNFPFQS